MTETTTQTEPASWEVGEEERERVISIGLVTPEIDEILRNRETIYVDLRIDDGDIKAEAYSQTEFNYIRYSVPNPRELTSGRRASNHQGSSIHDGQRIYVDHRRFIEMLATENNSEVDTRRIKRDGLEAVKLLGKNNRDISMFLREPDPQMF